MENIKVTLGPVVGQGESTAIGQPAIQPAVSVDSSTPCDLGADQIETGDSDQMISGQAVISGDSSSARVTDDLDKAEEISAVSMTEEDQKQILEELENL